MSEINKKTEIDFSKKTIVFDVDGVLFEYHGWNGIDHYGEPNREMIKLCNDLYMSGEYEICIWSTRTNPYVQGYALEDLMDRLRYQLDTNGVLYHKILEEPKPLYSILIDDRTANPNYLHLAFVEDKLMIGIPFVVHSNDDDIPFNLIGGIN